MHLQKTIPGFKRETDRCQHALASMVWMGCTKHRRHPHFQGAMIFTYEELDEWFGRGQFKGVNDRLKFFRVSDNWLFKLPVSVRTGDNFTKGYCSQTWRRRKEVNTLIGAGAKKQECYSSKAKF